MSGIVGPGRREAVWFQKAVEVAARLGEVERGSVEEAALALELWAILEAGGDPGYPSAYDRLVEKTGAAVWLAAMKLVEARGEVPAPAPAPELAPAAAANGAQPSAPAARYGLDPHPRSDRVL